MSDKLQKTIQRFQIKIDNGNFYEAHQTLRTITNRYVKSKQYDEAIKLLYEGSIILAKNKEYTSSVDLIIYLLEVLQESGKTSEDKHIKSLLIETINYLPDDEVLLSDLSKIVVDWSKTSVNKFGDADLHHVFGSKFLNAIKITKAGEAEKEKVFKLSEFHLTFGTINSLNLYIEFLYNWWSGLNDKSIDPGVFLARPVINYAYLKNGDFVKESITRFLKHFQAEKIENIYYFEEYKLLNFVQLLAVTLSKEAGNKYLRLYQTYKPELVQSELINSVEYLGRYYFNLPLGNPNSGQNMLSNLMGGLFN